VAVALSRLGRPVRFATSYADDAHGALVSEFLARDGVVLATDPAAVVRTSTAAATIGSDGAASYVFDFDWRLNPLLPSGTDPLAVHACSLGAVIEPGADSALEMVRALRDRATVSYDVNARPAVTGTGAEVVALVERMVAISDVVKASDEDLAALYPDLDLETAARRLLDLGPAAVVVTRGAEGASWFGHSANVEAAPVAVSPPAPTVAADAAPIAVPPPAAVAASLAAGPVPSRLAALAEDREALRALVAQLDQREQALRQRERELADQRRVLAEEYRLLRMQRSGAPAAPGGRAQGPPSARSGSLFAPEAQQATAWARFKRFMLGHASPAIEN